MSKIKHRAIACDDPEGAAQFYEAVFRLKRVGQVESRDVDGVYLTDADLNLALLNVKAGAMYDEMQCGDAPSKGLHHIGFLVEDTGATRERLTSHGATARNQRPLNANMFFEEKFTAAGDVIVDSTDHPWPGGTPLPT